MIPKEVQQHFDEIAQKYAQRLLKDVREVLSRPQFRRSGELEQSLKISVTKSTDRDSPKIILTYADQGYFIGYGSPMWKQLPNIDKLNEWAKNTDFTGPVPGYKSGTAPNLPPWKAKERRVFAIARSKQKFDTHKPKRWKRAAGLRDLLAALNEDTAASFAKDIEDGIVKSMTKTS